MEMQPDWGPGRVDTFNPYKLMQFGVEASALTPEERIGVADLPAVFDQRPRQGMNLHWDGNNAEPCRAQSVGRDRRRRHAWNRSTMMPSSASPIGWAT